MNNKVLREWATQKLNLSHLSTRKLGEKIGASHAKISRILSGEQDGDFGFYLELARAFDAVPEFLRVADILPDEGKEGALFTDILAAAKELTEDEREEILRYMLFVKDGRKNRPGLNEAPSPT